MKIEKLQNPYVRGNEGCSVSMIDLLEKINEIIDAKNGEHDPADIYSEDGRLIAKKDESEDERIRKWLIEYFGSIKETVWIHKDITCEQILAWLEKQKEQIPYTDFVIKPHKGDDNNPYDMRVSEAQEYAIKRGFGVPFNDGEVYVDERHLTQTIGNILRWADEHPKEQKELPLMDGNADLYFDEWNQQKQNPTKRQCFEEGIRYAQRLQKEQKPATTEDMPYVADEHFFEREPADSFKYRLAEYMTKNCKKGEGPYGYSYNISAESILKMAKEELLKRGELKEQKPAWSEEDEQIRDNIICVLQKDVTYTPPTRPNSCTGSGNAFYTHQTEIDWLKSLRPSWKPSEEQMEALRVASTASPTDSYILSQLYEHLKKL